MSVVAFDQGTYGSDRAGLVCAYAFAPGEPGRSIDANEGAECLGTYSDEHPLFLWLHFSLSNVASERWLRQHLSLPSAFYESLQEHRSTRVEVVNDALLAVVHDLEFFGAEESSASTVMLYVDPRVMVSARTTPVRALDRLRAAVKAGARFSSPASLLGHLLRDQADILVDIVRDAAVRVDEIEDKLLESQLSVSRPRLASLRRALVRLQRLLAPEPAVLFRLLNRPPQWLQEGDIVELRRSAEELSAAVADSAAVVDRIRLLQDDLSAHLDEATNRTLFILTILTAIVAPFEFISQLFGMGVGGVPFHDNPHGFFIVFSIILIVIGLGAVLVRKLIVKS